MDKPKRNSINQVKNFYSNQMLGIVCLFKLYARMLPISCLEVVCPNLEMTREREFLQILAHGIFVSLYLAARASLSHGRQVGAAAGRTLW